LKPIPLPLAEERSPPAKVACTECGKCCTYVGIEINAPDKKRYATDILWYLYHQGVYVYRDGDGEWSVHFETRCRNLDDALLCRIYAERPHICRDFDDASCEVNAPEGDTLTFREPRAFLDWLRRERPRLYRGIEQKYVPSALREGS
jgi:uncharacterized protein